MDNLPFAVSPVPDQRAPIEKSRPVIQMKGDDGDSVADILNQEVPGLDIHVWRRLPIAADLFEDSSEGAFKFCASVGPRGDRAGIEDGGIVLERLAESVPIEVIESGDKSCERSF